ncbi:hypothetical protein [Nesterenkonia sp. CF4.4]|uniref:hypothetical protein n=1 Tax=Nesterenkonia sp. CF4.4 TaxID=3373079 RepID=UPI003EE764DA
MSGSVDMALSLYFRWRSIPQDLLLRDTWHMEDDREPSLAWQGFDAMRRDIVECRSTFERNLILGLPTTERVRQTAEMKIPTHAEMMDAAGFPDHPVRGVNPSAAAALLSFLLGRRPSSDRY